MSTVSKTETPAVRPDNRPREGFLERMDAFLIGLVTCLVTIYYVNKIPLVADFPYADPYLIQTYKYSLPFWSVGLYLVMVHVVAPWWSKVRADKKDADAAFFKLPLKLWNLFLAWGSLLMLVALLILKVQRSWKVERPVYDWVCDIDDASWHGPLWFWVWLFANSKYIELIDTVFLVVRHKPVSFLHWYHHTTVLLFSWFAAVTRYSPGFTFGIINAFVHTVMYWYYYRVACGYKCTYDRHLTRLQMIQMVFGVLLTLLWAWYHFSGEECPTTYPMLAIAASAVMYGSYFFLFFTFYLRRYNKKVPAKVE